MCSGRRRMCQHPSVYCWGTIETGTKPGVFPFGSGGGDGLLLLYHHHFKPSFYLCQQKSIENLCHAEEEMCKTLKEMRIREKPYSFLIQRRTDEGEGGIRESEKNKGRAEWTLISIILGSNEETWSVQFTSKACLCDQTSLRNKH